MDLIVMSAAEEFQINGFAATSIDAVARRAGVSSRTLYRLVPTKADLFAKVISVQIGRFIGAIDDHALGKLSLDVALERILVAYGKLTLGQPALAISQLVIAERGRFPELAKTFYEEAILKAGHALEHWLLAQRDLAHIAFKDVAIVSGMLRGMMIMEPQRAIMLGQRTDLPDPEEIRQRARECARFFLDGCRVRT